MPTETRIPVMLHEPVRLPARNSDSNISSPKNQVDNNSNHHPLNLKPFSALDLYQESPSSSSASHHSNSSHQPRIKGILKRRESVDNHSQNFNSNYHSQFFTATTPDNYAKPNIRIHPTEMQRYLRNLLRRSSLLTEKEDSNNFDSVDTTLNSNKYTLKKKTEYNFKSLNQSNTNQDQQGHPPQKGNVKEEEEEEEEPSRNSMTAQVAPDINNQLCQDSHPMNNNPSASSSSASSRFPVKNCNDFTCLDATEMACGKRRNDPFSSTTCFRGSSVTTASSELPGKNTNSKTLTTTMPRAVSNIDHHHSYRGSNNNSPFSQRVLASGTSGNNGSGSAAEGLSTRNVSPANAGGGSSEKQADSNEKSAETSTLSSSVPPSPNPSNPNSGSSNSNKSNQKNDKPVEVLHKSIVIARFRTQTECAKYLRATPEAVSYHCSKGGGICNGLTIRPSQREAAATSADANKSGVDDKEKSNTNTSVEYGLFEGATEHRPKVRPQLAPEAVAILKDWLLHPDHMDNPYPNAHESDLLLKKTGLEKGQLKHWFNNARKRILKPLLKGDMNGEKKRQLLEARRGSVESFNNGSNGGCGVGGRNSAKRRRMNRTSSVMTGDSNTVGRNESPSTMMMMDVRHGRNGSMGMMTGSAGVMMGDSSSMMMNGGGGGGMIDNNCMMPPSNNNNFNNMNGHFHDHSQGNNSFFGGNDSSNIPNSFSRSSSNTMHNDFGNIANQNNGINPGPRSNFRGSPTESFDQQGNGGGMIGMSSSAINVNAGHSFPNNGNMNGNFDTMVPNSNSRSSPGLALCYDSSAMTSGNGMSGCGGMRGNDMGRSFHGNNDNGGFGGASMDGGFHDGRFNIGGGNGGDGNRLGGFDDQFEPSPIDFRGSAKGKNGGASDMGGSSWQSNGQSNNRSSFGMMNDSSNGTMNNDFGPQDDSRDFCRPLPVNQHEDPSFSFNHFNGNQNDISSSSSNPTSNNSDCPNSDREHAIFKQQVAAMAMNQATNAFKEMEEAYMHAKEIMAEVSESNKINPEDDPKVIEANALAKKCHSVAMFKLKVSQRANEEAANAYKRYQVVNGGGGGMVDL